MNMKLSFHASNCTTKYFHLYGWTCYWWTFTLLEMRTTSSRLLKESMWYWLLLITDITSKRKEQTVSSLSHVGKGGKIKCMWEPFKQTPRPRKALQENKFNGGRLYLPSEFPENGGESFAMGNCWLITGSKIFTTPLHENLEFQVTLFPQGRPKMQGKSKANSNVAFLLSRSQEHLWCFVPVLRRLKRISPILSNPVFKITSGSEVVSISFRTYPEMRTGRWWRMSWRIMNPFQPRR